MIKQDSVVFWAGGRIGVLFLCDFLSGHSEARNIACGLHLDYGFSVLFYPWAVAENSERFRCAAWMLELMNRHMDVVFVGGVSAGVMLVLKLARLFPEKIRGLAIYAVPPVRNFWNFWKFLKIFDSSRKCRFTDQVRQDLPHIRTPALLVHTRSAGADALRDACYIRDKLGGSADLIVLDQEYRKICTATGSFFLDLLNKAERYDFLAHFDLFRADQH